MRGIGVVAALAGIGRRLIGGFRTRDASYYAGRSKYMPHQGKQEIARRLRQAEQIADKIPTFSPGDLRSYQNQLVDSVLKVDRQSYEEFANGVDLTPQMFGATALTTSDKPIGQVQDSGNPVGKRVTWSSNGVEKVGEITHVVPAGQTPSDVGAKVKDAGTPRDHESFVVFAATTDAKKATSYWPRVGVLKFA